MGTKTRHAAGGSTGKRLGRKENLKITPKGCPSPNPSGLSRERRAQIEECRAVALDILAEDPAGTPAPALTRLHAILRGLAAKALDDPSAARELFNRAYGQAPQHFTADANVFLRIERVIVKPKA